MKIRKLFKRVASILAVGVVPLIFFLLIAIMNILVIIWLFQAVIGVLPSTVLDEKKEEEPAVEQSEPYNPLMFDGSFIEGGGGNEPTFSESELSAIGGNLPNYYKNWYKILGLTKESIDNFSEWSGRSYASGFITNKTRFDALLLRTIAGITSSESAGSFYKTGEDVKDVLKDPSDYPANQWGYGVLGVHKDTSLEESYGGAVAGRIKGKYTPVSTPQYPSAFYPWGVPVQVQMFMSKDFWLGQGNMSEEMDRALDAFGITNMDDRGLAREFMALAVMYAGYHGSSDNTNKAVVQIIGALLATTKDSNGRISISRLDYKPKSENDYSESSFRTVMLGVRPDSAYSGIYSISSNNGCGRLGFSGLERGTFYINGQALTVPVYKYLHDSHNSGSARVIRDEYESILVDMANSWIGDGFASTGYGVTILNPHLTLNSFLQGNRVYNKIASMGGMSGSGGSEGSSGGGSRPITSNGSGAQGIYNGGTLEQFIAANGNVGLNYYNKMKEYFGKAVVTVGYKGTESCYWYANPKERSFEWRPSRWGAPHYYQYTMRGSKIEAYGNRDWFNGSLVRAHESQGGTFDYTGCMLYTYAYATTCVTGRVINAAEYTTALKAVHGVSEYGINNQGIQKVSAALGIDIDGPYPNTSGNVNRMFNEYRDNILSGKGVMVVYMTSYEGTPQNESFTRAGAMHFICLYDAKVENGRYWYRVYEPLRAELCTKWYSEENIKRLVYTGGQTGICYLADARYKYRNSDSPSRGGRAHERED